VKIEMSENLLKLENNLKPEPSWKASATLVSGNDDPEQGGGASGDITFKQWGLNSPIQVNVNITGLKPGKHAIHIHAFGDLSDGCKSTGPHFRHSIVGNIEANEEGKSEIKFNTRGLELFGLYGILGRSIVVHEKASGK
jgi:superoxide dismutase, Cu-Zn family